MKASNFAAGCLASLAALSCSPRENSREPRLQFEDIAPQAGLDRVARSGSATKLWILENIGTGCALFDADGDGRLDVFLANAGVVSGSELLPGPGPALYLQVADKRFADRTEAAGLKSDAWQTGVAVGDVDNDGDLDLFVAGYRRNALYRNRGGGVFDEATQAAGLQSDRFATSAVFLDYDRDGFIDLYSANYVRFDPRRPPNDGKPCIQSGVEVACGPGHCDPEPDRLYHNERGEKFTDASDAAGISSAEGSYGLGTAAGDIDDDGWPDVYVANDTTANFLWRNLQGARFEDVALYRGAALSDSGQGQAGMGTEIADADGDGAMDIFVTNYSEENNAFYRGLGNGTFEEASRSAGLADASFLMLGWGAKCIDLDNDADLDIVVANGHVWPQAGQVNKALTYEEHCSVYLNTGSGRFVEQGSSMFAVRKSYRGLAVGDVDADGDVDILLTALDSPPCLLENRGVSLGHWISLRLEGTKSNREGIGARVWVTAGGTTQVRDVTRGGSYLSASDARLHFGLGRARAADAVRIRWPSGLEEKLGPLEAGRRYHIVEGKGGAPTLEAAPTPGQPR